MTGGLREKDLQIICEVLKRFADVDEAILFGSRAKGNYQPGSDVDLALKGQALSPTIARISGCLNDESPLPYRFDIIDYHGLTNDELREHIDRVGVIVYRRELRR